MIFGLGLPYASTSPSLSDASRLSRISFSLPSSQASQIWNGSAVETASGRQFDALDVADQLIALSSAKRRALRIAAIACSSSLFSLATIPSGMGEQDLLPTMS